MKTTAKSSNNHRNSSNRQKNKKKQTYNELETYDPAYSLEDMLQLRQNKEAYIIFVRHFLKPAYSTKWKKKRYEQNIKKIADILTVSDEAFVLLALENNWERWVDINNKAKNNYTASTQGTASIDSNVMPKYTHINKKRTDLASKDPAPAVWRGWNNDGILRFNELCKAVKADRLSNADMDKTILSHIDPKETTQRPQKRRKKMPAVAKAYVESDDDESNTESEQDNESDSNSDDDNEE